MRIGRTSWIGAYPAKNFVESSGDRQERRGAAASTKLALPQRAFRIVRIERYRSPTRETALICLFWPGRPIVESPLSPDLKAIASETEAVHPAESIADRFAPRRRRRDLVRRWQAAIPFWLCSLILHLVSFLIIASLSCPWSGGRGPSGSRGVSLVISFGVDEHNRGEQSVVLPTNEATEPAPIRGADEEEDLPRVAQPPTPKEAPQPEQQPPASPSRSVQEATQPQPRTVFEKWAQMAMADPNFGKAPSPYAALMNRNRQRSTPPPLTSNPLLATTHSTDSVTDESDQIVDDFIAYDIGKLRGRAGQQAHRRFMAMGAEGIPAVVRGLNKAATINASCPVGVLAGKLMSLLQSLRDPSLNQYAIDNLGRGVPETAPHYRRIVALRDRWLGGTPGVEKQTVSQLVAQHGLQQDGEFVELVLALTDAPAETVLAALQTPDPKLRDAALLALIQSHYPLHEHPRRAIIRELTRLAGDPSLGTRQALARSALQSVRGSVTR